MDRKKRNASIPQGILRLNGRCPYECRSKKRNCLKEEAMGQSFCHNEVKFKDDLYCAYYFIPINNAQKCPHTFKLMEVLKGQLKQ